MHSRLVYLMLPGLTVLVLCTAYPGRGQESGVVMQELFDATVPPALPAGWLSSRRRTSGSNDVVTTSTSPASPPNAVLVTNATLEQWLQSPPVLFPGTVPGRLRFLSRRSSTFGARVVVEASTDGGNSFALPLGAAAPQGSGTGYVPSELSVPPQLAEGHPIVFRWWVVPDSSGSTGTFRIDDVRLEIERSPPAPGSVVVNEIMYQPLLGGPEWVELVNWSETDVDVGGWTLEDASGGSPHLLTARSTVVKAGGYAVLVGDSARLAALRPDIQGIVIQTASFPSLNNGGDLLVLRDFRGTVIDSLQYDAAWGGGPGISLERRDAGAASSMAQNWGASRDARGATPGAINSIARRENDLRAGRITLVSCPPGGPALLSARVHNAGRTPTSPFRVRVFDDSDRNGTGSDGETVATAEIAGTLLPLDSSEVSVLWLRPAPGTHLLILETTWHADEQAANNMHADSVQVPIPERALSINEIMFAPVGGTREYVELINTGTDDVELDGCTLEDRRLPSGNVNTWNLTRNPLRLKPGAFFVLAGDSLDARWMPAEAVSHTVAGNSGLGLNNDEDDVILRGPDGRTIDSVAYSSHWHSANSPHPDGRSLERIHPLLKSTDAANWGSSVHPSGGTPGAGNSITVPLHRGPGLLSCFPTPFSPDGDGWEDFTIIRYALPMRTALMRLKVFDVRGRLVRELANSTPAGPEGSVVWNGFDDVGRRVRVGIYILLLEAIDGEGGMLVTCKTTAIVATRL